MTMAYKLQADTIVTCSFLPVLFVQIVKKKQLVQVPSAEVWRNKQGSHVV